jgi:hypothetical protein
VLRAEQPRVDGVTEHEQRHRPALDVVLLVEVPRVVGAVDREQFDPLGWFGEQFVEHLAEFVARFAVVEPDVDDGAGEQPGDRPEPVAVDGDERLGSPLLARRRATEPLEERDDADPRLGGQIGEPLGERQVEREELPVVGSDLGDERAPVLVGAVDGPGDPLLDRRLVEPLDGLAGPLDRLGERLRDAEPVVGLDQYPAAHERLGDRLRGHLGILVRHVRPVRARPARSFRVPSTGPRRHPGDPTCPIPNG